MDQWSTEASGYSPSSLPTVLLSQMKSVELMIINYVFLSCQTLFLLYHSISIIESFLFDLHYIFKSMSRTCNSHKCLSSILTCHLLFLSIPYPIQILYTSKRNVEGSENHHVILLINEFEIWFLKMPPLLLLLILSHLSFHLDQMKEYQLTFVAFIKLIFLVKHHNQITFIFICLFFLRFILLLFVFLEVIFSICLKIIEAIFVLTIILC
jgi:hypothetical protein